VAADWVASTAFAASEAIPSLGFGASLGGAASCFLHPLTAAKPAHITIPVITNQIFIGSMFVLNFTCLSALSGLGYHPDRR
jgi:hypothetical protein